MLPLMINTKINKVKAQGDNIFIFQYIDAEGHQTEEKKSFEEFLMPFIKPYQEQIELLRKAFEDKQKIEGFLDKEVLELSGKITVLEKEKNSLVDQVSHFLKELENKDLSKTTALYQEAFEYFINGQLENALNVLDEAKMEEEEQLALESIKQKAETRLLKAQILRVKNNFEEAGLNYEKALQLFTNWSNSLEVANYFKFLNQFEKAAQYYNLCMNQVQTDSEKAVVLNNLGILQKIKNELEKAEQFYEEALEINRKLAEEDSQVYLPEVATTLSNLGNLQRTKNELEKAEKSYEEALAIRRKLAEVNPQIALPFVSIILNNLGNLHRDKNELEKAEQSYEEALAIRRKLAEEKPETYLPNVATSLNNLGVLQRAKNELEKAEKFHEEALAIRRKLTEENPQAYLPDVATTLNNLGVLQYKKNELEKAEQSYEEALAIRRKLGEVNPQTYLPDVGTTLANLGNLQRTKNELEKAEKSYEEALEIYRKLAEVNPPTYLPYLSMTQITMSVYYLESKPNKELSIKLAEKAISNLLPFSKIPYIQNYLKLAFEVLEDWGIDIDEYMKDIK